MKVKTEKEEKSLPEMQEKLTPWQQVALARDAGRPGVVDYIAHLFTDFFEQRGDRCGGEDSAILGGIARFHGIPVTVLEKIWMKISPAVSACLPRKVIGKRSV